MKQHDGYTYLISFAIPDSYSKFDRKLPNQKEGFLYYTCEIFSNSALLVKRDILDKIEYYLFYKGIAVNKLDIQITFIERRI